MNIVTAKDIKPELAKKVYGYLEKKEDGFSLTVDGFAYVCELCTGEPHSRRTIRYWCERGLLGENGARKHGKSWYIHKSEAVKILFKFFPHEKEEALQKAYDAQMKFFGS